MIGLAHLVGAATIALVWSVAAMGVEASLGLVRVHWIGFQPSARRHATLALFVLATAAVEEIFYRFFLLRSLAFRFDPDIAVAISALAFGMSHVFAAKGQRWRTVASTACAGVWLGYCYLVTRSLPLVIGFHFAWNFSINLIGYEGSSLASVSANLVPVGPLGARFSHPAWLPTRDAAAAVQALRASLVLLAAVALRCIAG